MATFGTFGSPPAVGGLFGANKTAGFGGFGTATTNPTFGTATGTGTGFFGTTQPSTAFQLGAPATSMASTTTQPTGLSFNPQPTFGAPTTAATTGFGTATPSFNFGLPKTTPPTSFGFGTSIPSTGLGLSLTSTAPTQPSTGFSFAPATQPSFGVKPTTALTSLPSFPAASTGFQLGGTSTLFGAKTDASATLSTSNATSIGLGGVDTTQSKPGLAGPSVTEPKQAKDNPLPDLVFQTITDFQTFTRQQKSISVAISQSSAKPLAKVQEDMEALDTLLATLNSGVTKNSIAVDRLKAETAQGLHQAEMAQRTHELPPGLEYDNSASAEYFDDLVAKFEADALRLRVQMETAEKHLNSLTQSSAISPQELTLAMRRLHETLVVLAARVQTLHTNVSSHKEQYRNLRRVYLKDDTAVFKRDKPAYSTVAKKPSTYSLRSLTGPTPFSGAPGGGSFNQDALAALSSSTASAFSAVTADPGWMNAIPNTTGLANTTAVLTPQLSTENSGFTLSKPPVGNKRNKHA